MLVSEYGWSTRGLSARFPAVSENTRTVWIEESTEKLAASACGIIGVAPHTWVSAQRNPISINDWYGMVDYATGRPFRTAIAYSAAVTNLEGTGVARDDAC
jgi:hypothetical protein